MIVARYNKNTLPLSEDAVYPQKESIQITSFGLKTYTAIYILEFARVSRRALKAIDFS